MATRLMIRELPGSLFSSTNGLLCDVTRRSPDDEFQEFINF